MIDILLCLLALVLAAVYAYLRPGWRRTGPYLPDSYLAGLVLFTIGATFNASGMATDAARQVATMGWLALCSALAGAAVAARAATYPESFVEHVKASRATPPTERSLIKWGLIVSSLACIGFIYAVLTSAPLTALLSIGSLVQDSSLLAVRKMITAGTDGYFAPGYVKQFRDILIPVLLSGYMAMNARFSRSFLFWGVVCVGLFAMVITGQRLIIVVAAGTILMAAHYVAAMRLRAIVIAGVFILAAYGALTMLLGRVEQHGTAADAAVEIVANVLDRAIVTVPRENSITHSVWGSGPTMGESWLDDLSGIVPGARRGHLSNLLHATAGGSEEGNSPLALPVDTWLAWGWPGLAVFPAIFALCLAFLDRLLVSRRSVTLFGLKAYLAFVVPIFYSPYLFILYGGAIAVVLVTAVRIIRRAHHRKTGAPKHFSSIARSGAR